MNNYVDKYGRYHTKPVTELKPVPTNNGWIYTAYAKKLGLPLDRPALQWGFDNCNYQTAYQIVLIRSPGKELPPISRDEILGMAELELLKPKHLNGWSFSPKPIPKFNLIKLIQQLLEVRGKHRNYFWENNLDQIYRFAYSVPLVDRHFIQQKWGQFNPIYWAIAKLDSLLGGKSAIRSLKYDKNYMYMKAEFPADHPARV